jgi:hypothetical protein
MVNGSPLSNQSKASRLEKSRLNFLRLNEVATNNGKICNDTLQNSLGSLVAQPYEQQADLKLQIHISELTNDKRA